jgi:hypothetical protein
MLRVFGIAAGILLAATSFSRADECERIASDMTHCYTRNQVERYESCMASGDGANRSHQTPHRYCLMWAAG